MNEKTKQAFLERLKQYEEIPPKAIYFEDEVPADVDADILVVFGAAVEISTIAVVANAGWQGTVQEYHGDVALNIWLEN